MRGSLISWLTGPGGGKEKAIDDAPHITGQREKRSGGEEGDEMGNETPPSFGHFGKKRIATVLIYLLRPPSVIDRQGGGETRKRKKTRSPRRNFQIPFLVFLRGRKEWREKREKSLYF